MDLLQSGDLYGRIGMRDTAFRAECVFYAREESKRCGLKPPEERKARTTRRYCGAGQARQIGASPAI